MIPVNSDISPELLKRYLAGETEAINEVVAIIIERDRELLDRLSVDD
jgi:hypothetical protein